MGQKLTGRQRRKYRIRNKIAGSPARPRLTVFRSARHIYAQIVDDVGGSTLEAQDNIGTEVASKLVRYSDNGSTLSAVNFPEVTLPGHEGSQRILHIHRNVPGVLSQVNEVFSQAGLNIDGQYLRTDADIGYVVIDVAATPEQAQALRARLAEIAGTLRTRVLH